MSTTTKYDRQSNCFCGGELEGFTYHFHYRECKKCGSFISKVEKPAALKEFYGFENYWHKHQKALGQPEIEDRAVNDVLDGRIWKIVDIIKELEDVYSIFEIGCAPGIQLAVLQSMGYHCAGIEPDVETCIYLEKKFKLITYSGLFPDNMSILPRSYYNLVLACDVFEHTFDPVEFLWATRKLFWSKGYVLLQVPIYYPNEWEGSFPFGINFKRMFLENEHIHIYSKKAIEMLSDEANYDIIKIDRWRPCHDIVLLQLREG